MKKLKSLIVVVGALICVLPTFGQNQATVGYGLVVDNTLSMMNALDSEIALAKEIVKATNKDSYVSYFAFATDPVSKLAQLARGIQCTTDREIVNKQLEQIFAVTGQTKLIDGIWAAAEQIDDKRPDKCPAFSEKHLLLITDGEDRGSTAKPADLISGLKSRGVKVSVIGMITGLSDDRGFMPRSARDSAREFIDRLTKETGGNVVYPKKGQSPTDIVKALLEPKIKK